jgi:hypothetical protein
MVVVKSIDYWVDNDIPGMGLIYTIPNKPINHIYWLEV